MNDQQIIQTVKNLFSGTDEQNWNKVINTMAENVLLDYTSMAGGSPASLTPKQIVAAWAGLLPGFDKTHHQLSNFKLTTEGNHAKVHYVGKADHYLNNVCWTVEGSYDTVLEKQSGTWKITKQRFNLSNQTGDTSLPEKAMNIVKNRQ